MQRGIYFHHHTLSLAASMSCKSRLYFFTPLLRVWSKCFRSCTKNVHTSVSLWRQGMPQRVFDTSFHIYLIRWCQKEGNWQFTMASFVSSRIEQTVWPIWQHYFILSSFAILKYHLYEIDMKIILKCLQDILLYSLTPETYSDAQAIWMDNIYSILKGSSRRISLM